MLNADFADFGPLQDGGVGEKNGLERAKTGVFWQPGQTSKSAGIRVNPRKHAGVPEKCPTAYTVGHKYWWRRRESNPRPQILYRQFYILSAAI